MKEKGFTLIEVIAVVVLLAVIALIATPQVLKTIGDSKKNAFRTSAEGLMESAEQAHTDMQFEGKIREVIEFNLTTKKNMEDIHVKGDGPEDGYIRINPTGLTEVAVKNSRYCAVKNYSDQKMRVYSIKNKACDVNMSSNLVTNGFGELGDNTNMKQMQYKVEGDTSYFTMTTSSNRTIVMDEFIPVDSAKKYQIMADFRANNTTATHYIGVIEYDDRKQGIGAENVMYIGNTLTSLAQDLNNGDTIVYLSSLANWNVATATRTYQRGFIFWNYQDEAGNIYPESTYSKNVFTNLYVDTAVNKTANTITLTSPWSRGSYKTGTKLSQSSSGGTYNYGLLTGGTTTTTWKNYKNTMSGNAYPSATKFRYGTKYIRFFFFGNYNNIANTTVDVKNISIREVE